jgi:hypothetical protein
MAAAMSRQLEQADGSCRDIAAAFLEGPAQAWLWPRSVFVPSAPVQHEDEADEARVEPRRDVAGGARREWAVIADEGASTRASQLIQPLAGRRSPA